MFGSKARLPIAIALATMAMAGCGGGGSSSSGAVSSGGGGGDDGSGLQGYAVKGPLVGASVSAYAIDYSAPDLIGGASPVDTGSTNSRAQFAGVNLAPESAPYIVVVEADADTKDLTTGAAPVITTLKTVVTAEMLNSDTPVMATPLTSLATEVAATKGLTADSLEQVLTDAQNAVKSTLGFGLDESLDIFTAMPVLSDDANTPEEQEKVAAYRLAVEAISAVLSNAAADSSATDDSATDVLSLIAQDLSDGAIDGQKDGVALTELNGVDVTATLVADLTIPGTDTPVSNITTVLNEEAASLGTTTTVDASVTVTPEEVATVVDTDFDGVADDTDNCLDIKNGDQLDANGNNVGAACESAPQISPANGSGPEDGGPITIDLIGTDAEGDTLTFTVDGVALPAGQATYDYTPAADFHGQEVLTYTVSDGEHSSVESTITIDVTPVDDAPAGTLTIDGPAEEGVELSLDNQLTDADGTLSVVSWQWFADGVAIEGATSPTFTPLQAQVGAQIHAEVVVSDGAFADATVVSDSTAAIANTVNNPTGGEVVIVGTPSEGEALTIDGTLVDPDGPVTVQSYTWLADGSPISGASTSELVLTQDQVGKAIRVQLTYTDGTFSGQYTTAATDQVTNVNNPATGTVTISGDATEDQTLTAQPNVSDEDGLAAVEYSYQWLADGAAIDGATADQLTLNDSHVGKRISVTVTFTDEQGGNESVPSDETAAVANVNDPVQGSVVITGTAMETQVLSVTDFLSGLSDDDGLPATAPAETTYQWKRSGTPITGATNATYTLVSDDVSHVMTAVISFPDNRGTTETVETEATAMVQPFNNQPTGSVIISGDTQNQTWTVSNDLADADGPASLAVSYQWYADGSAITGETASSFTPDQQYVDASIFVRASYTDDDGNDHQVDSDPVTVIDVDDSHTGGVTIGGTAEEDQTLSATHDLADPDGDIVIVGYQWKAGGANIAGATTDSLVLTQNEVGQTITVDLTFNDGTFADQTVTSTATSAVANVNDLPEGSVSITGTASPGNDLAVVDTISDEDGMGPVSYEWFVDGVSAATGISYTVQQADVGLDVIVGASYVDGQGTSEVVYSAAVTVEGEAQSPAFNPASFSGQTVYDVYLEDADDSECVGTTTFVRIELDAGGTFAGRSACDDSAVDGSWWFEQNDEVLVLSSADFDQDNYVVAMADPVDNKQAYCWIDDGDVLSPATALDICRNGESSSEYYLVQDANDQLGSGEFYFNLADVHADTFDTKRFSHTWLAGRTLYDVWYGNVDYNGDCEPDTEHDRGMTQLVFSDDGMTLDITGLQNDTCNEIGVVAELSAAGQIGGEDSGINYLGSTDLYLEMVFKNEDGSPDNVDRFYHTLSDAEAAFNALPGAGVLGTTYTQNFLESQLLKSPIYNVHQVDGQWYIEKIEFFGDGNAELTERSADDVRFGDDAAFYSPQPTTYAVSADHISLTSINQGEIYWHIADDPNIGAGYMTSFGNGFEVCWGDCQSSIEWLFFSEEAAQAYVDNQNASATTPLVGSWLIDEGVNQRNILTFIDSTRYVVFHEHSNADQSAGSAEYGTYTWDQETGAFTATATAESDGAGGLDGAAFNLVLNGDTFTTDDGFGADRIVDEANPIVGSWLGGDGDDITVLTMLSDTEYAIVHTQNGECYGEPCTPQALSGEFGTYSWDGYNFTAISVSVDTNGVGGLFNAEDPSDQEGESIEIDGAQLTFTDANEGSFILHRIAPLMSLTCGYESGWDDMADAPLIFNSQDDYNTVVADCDQQNGPLPAFSMTDLADKTLYDGESEIVFDASGASGVATEYGDDGIKGTADDYSFFVYVSDYGTNQVLWEYSTTDGGAIEAYDLLTLLSSEAGNYEFAVFYEDYLWPESDGSVNLDTARKDGEIWYWNFSETEQVLTACETGDGGYSEFTNTFADYESAVAACSVSARGITNNDLVGMSWDFGGESIVFYSDNTAVLDGTEGFTWSLDGTYLEMWADSGTYYDVYAIVDEAVNSNGNTVISVKVYNEDSAGDLVRETGADGDIWSSVVVITPPPLTCNYQSGWDDATEKPLIFNSISDFNAVRTDCESTYGVPSFSRSDLAGQTFYEEWNETRFVFDATGSTAVGTDAGDDGALDTADDETFYITVSDFDTNVVKFEASQTQNGPVAATELWGLVNYDPNYSGDGKDLWQFRVLFEEHAWSESDQGTADVDNKDGEIWHNSVSTSSDFNWAGL